MEARQGAVFGILRLAHVIGLILFPGSIVVFVVVSTLSNGAGLAEVDLGRRIISAGTSALTLPGMWLLAASGLAMGLARHGLGSGYVRLKLLLAALVIANAYAFVVPTVHSATALAAASLAEGRLLPEFATAFKNEEIFGSLNLALILAAAVAGVWRIGARREAH